MPRGGEMDWTIVEVVIGLSFLFFLLSIVASAVNEFIAGIFKLRAKTLEKGITNLLTGSTSPPGGDLGIVGQLYSHALVNGYGKDKDKPSYLSSRSFRNALLDVTGLLEATSAPTDDPLQAEAIRREIQDAIDAIPLESLKDSLTTIWLSVHRDATEFRAGVERWFDRGMERVSGWYKRRAQIIVFIVGLAVAVAINGSALTAADRLWKDDGFRKGLVAQVERQQEATSGTQALDRLEELRFPIGWEESNRPQDAGGWALALLGWLLTGFAVTFGAPFWFDVLGKVSNLRAAGVKPDSVLTPAPAKWEASTVKLDIETGQPPT
jgi:hypothetical protein